MAGQLFPQSVGGALVAPVRVDSAAPVAREAGAVQSGHSHQAAQAICLAGLCGFAGACGVVCFWADDERTR